MRVKVVAGRRGYRCRTVLVLVPLRGPEVGMYDWNVVVSVRGDCYRWVRQRLCEYARVDNTDYYNVLALRAEDPDAFIEELCRATAVDPRLRDCLARARPAPHAFLFQTAEEFEQRAQQALAHFLPALGGRTFYVRMHRRGFRGTLASQKLEQLLDTYLLEHLDAAGTPGQVRFADADAVVVIETIGQWAGVTLIARELRVRCPFVNPE